MRLARLTGLAVLAVLVAGLGVPYLNANSYRERIENALEQALHRKVTVGKVRYNLLTGPGFAAEDVTIADDSSIGIEPFAYVESLTARVRLTTLWTRNLAFSNLRLKNPTVNLSKGDNGLWNFQLLLRDAAARSAGAHQFPSLQVRSGRINFKFGDYKTIFYLTDSDLDVSPASPDRLDIRFSGQPARTDQASQNFGRLLARGMWRRGPGGQYDVDANIELERSGISDMAHLVEGRDIGVHGIVASSAHVSGRLDKLKVAGQLRMEDVHRWDLLPPKSGGWDLQYQGTADLASQHLELQTDRTQNPNVPFLLHFRSSDFLSDPKWGASLEVKDAPVSAFLEVARHMGTPLPDGFSADGKVAGLIGYSRPGGVQGQFVIHDSSVRLQNAPPLDIRSADFLVNGNDIRVGPSTVALSDGQTADVEGTYSAATGALNVQVTTAGMKVVELRTGSGRLLGAAAIPVLDACRQGTWSGSLRYARPGTEAEGGWSGTFELRAARLELDGLEESLRIQFASVDVDGPRVTLTQIRGRAGTAAFRGEFHRDRPGRPDRLKLEIEEVDALSLETMFLPTLRRDSGFLARFRLRTAPVPEWLRARNLEASVRIEKLAIAGQTWSVEVRRAVWDGTGIRVPNIDAHQGDERAAGEVWIDLSGNAPRFRAEGTLEDIDYRGGTLAIDGSGKTSGTGTDLLANAQASGVFTGDGLTLSPEAEFRSITGNFELSPGGRVRLTGIQASQGVEAYSGQGASQADGRMILELSTGKRQVRVAVAR